MHDVKCCLYDSNNFESLISNCMCKYIHALTPGQLREECNMLQCQLLRLALHTNRRHAAPQSLNIRNFSCTIVQIIINNKFYNNFDHKYLDYKTSITIT